jgi:small subunit ribosomal protein S36
MGATSKSERRPPPAPHSDESRPADPTHDRREPTPDRHVGSLAARIRSVPFFVVAITGLHLVVLLTYSFLLPTYRAPDEPLHVDLSHLFSEELTYPAWDDRNTGPGIQRSLGIVQFGTQSANLEADAAPLRGERPSIEDLDEPALATGINQLPQHPPLYYVTTGASMWLAEAVFGDPLGDFMLETWFYRVMSVLFVTSLPVVIWRVSHVLGLSRSVTVAAMLVPLAVPQYLHIGSSANNDNLVLLFIWMLTPVVVRVAGGALLPRTAALAGLLTGLAFLTKINAIVMPPWVLGALAVAYWRSGRTNLAAVTRFGFVYGIVALVAGGWWWVRNVVLFGEVFPSRFDQIAPPLPDAPRDVGDYLHTWAFSTTRRFWGEFGWYDTHLPGAVVGLATFACVVALAVACTRRDRAEHTALGTRLLLVAPLVVLVGAQFANSLRAYLATGRMAGLQGRYWFGALAGLAVVIALGIANLAGRWRRQAPLAVLASVVAMQLAAVATILGFYWGAPGSSLTDRLRAVVAWAPLPGVVLVVGATIGAIVVGVAVAQVVVSALPTGTDPDGADVPLDEIGAT